MTTVFTVCVGYGTSQCDLIILPMSTIDTILEAEREAKQIVEAAEAEATAVVQTAEDTKNKELRAEKQRLAEVEAETLAAFESELEKEVATMEQESVAAVQQLEQKAKTNHDQAVQAVITAMTR